MREQRARCDLSGKVQSHVSAVHEFNGAVSIGANRLTLGAARGCSGRLNKGVYNCSMDFLSYLRTLVGQPALVAVRYAQQAEGIVVAVEPTTDMPPATIPHAGRIAIDRSQFTVLFSNRDLLDGSNTRVISGRNISFPSLSVFTPIRAA
jgi:hypothetical protein